MIELVLSTLLVAQAVVLINWEAAWAWWDSVETSPFIEMLADYAQTK